MSSSTDLIHWVITQSDWKKWIVGLNSFDSIVSESLKSRSTPAFGSVFHFTGSSFRYVAVERIFSSVVSSLSPLTHILTCSTHDFSTHSMWNRVITKIRLHKPEISRDPQNQLVINECKYWDVNKLYHLSLIHISEPTRPY